MSFESEFAKFQKQAAERGYTPYSDAFINTDKGYAGSVQRRVMDGDATKYFLNMDIWDMSYLSGYALHPFRVNVSAQFNTLDNREGESVNISTEFTDFATIETMFEKMWNLMGFGHYSAPAPQAPEVPL